MSSAVGIPPDTVIGQKYRINRKIGSGSFGEIYSGTVIYQDSNQQVAIKFREEISQVSAIAPRIQGLSGIAGLHGYWQGHVLWYLPGLQRHGHGVTWTFPRGPVQSMWEKVFSQDDAATGRPTAGEAETLHENHLIHRDIKPANFVVSPGDTAAMVFCIDFGLSKRYRHPHTLQHIPYREGRSLTGTLDMPR